MDYIAMAKFRLKESRESHYTIQVWSISYPLWLYSGSDKQIYGIKSDRVPKELWMEVCHIVQEAVIKIISKKKKCKKAIWLSEKAFQIAEKRKDILIWMQSFKE